MTIGDLVVNLGLNRTGFSGGLNAARNELAGFGASTLKTVTGVGAGIAAGLAGFVGVSAIKSFTADAMELVDSTGELADTIGTTTESLIGLQHAASLGGSSSEGLNKSLEKMLVNVGAARKGVGSAKSYLDQFGLSADSLAAQDPSETFLTLADHISKLPSSADRASAALAIFGKSGVEMLPMLTGGAEGIREFMADAKNLGMTFSNLDSQQVAEANDAIDRLKAGTTGLFNQVAIGSAPFLTMLADGITAQVPLVAGGFRAMADFALDTFAMMGWGIENWQSIAEYAWASASLGVFQMGADIAHFFTGVLPTLFSWFGSNWSNLWTTALDFTLTVLINLGKNIRSIFASIWEFISSGGTKSLSLAWTPLTEGFRNTISEIPEIPARAISDMERGMIADTNRLGDQLGSSLGDAMAASWEARNSLATPSAAEGTPLASIAPDKKKGASAGGDKGPVAAKVDTVEAYKLIQSSGAAQVSAREAYLKKVADKQLKAAEGQLGLLRTIAENTGDSTVEEVDF